MTPHYIVVNGMPVDQFSVDHSRTEFSEVEGQYGKGYRLHVISRAEGPAGSVIEKQLTIDLYDDFPHSAIISNSSKTSLWI